MFATINPEFKSTYPLDEALLDRVSVCIPVYQPSFNGNPELSSTLNITFL
ncbi:hypothetical protein MSIBF_A2780002 [groundwater metagenome]|uniref:Uncharacterized protein n=1 Tax=groundwater metagenome TaxID=717931 RepID=A0A098E9Z4_9ZZZZ